MKSKLVLLTCVAFVITALLFFLVPFGVRTSGEGLVSIALAQADASPAYQLSIPNGVGNKTELSISHSGTPNWLTVSSREKNLQFTKDSLVSAIEQSPGITYNSTNNTVLVDSGSAQICWPDAPQVTLGSGLFNVSTGDTYVDEYGQTRRTETRVSWKDYVTGEGTDLYSLENFPQTDDIRLLPITTVRVYALTTGRANTVIATNGQEFSGSVINNKDEARISEVYTLNPVTQLPWTWIELDNLQAGITLYKDAQCFYLYIEVETEVHSQTFYPITPVEVTPDDASTWDDVDCSAYIASGATGVVLHCHTTVTTNPTIGIRKNGSTDARIDALRYYYHSSAVMGVDASRIFECYASSITDIDVYLIGYTMSGVTMFTNAYDKSTGTTGSWVDVDCSSECPSAVALLFEPANAWSYNFGLRKNGSTDARTNTMQDRSTIGAIIGCDGSQLCEQYISDTTLDLYLNGYVTDGVTMHTNGADRSLGSTGTWTDLSALPSDTVMGFYEQINTNYQQLYGLRKNGSAEDIVAGSGTHCWFIVECDASQLVEGEISNLAVDFFEIGYATSETTPSISNTPATWAIGTVSVSTDYWSSGSAPSWPLDDGECHFTVTNDTGGGNAVDITVEAINFTGGVGWTLTSGSPGENTVRMRAGKSGDANEAAMVVITTSGQAFISSLADTASKKWELKLESATSHTDGAEKTSTVTLTASLS